MKKTSIIGMCVGIFLGILVLTFVLGGFNLLYRKVFEPAHENVSRQVFENTQSYTHGKIQDLSKHYNEYRKADDLVEKEAIKQIIIQQFAQFDSSKVVDANLRQFLTTMRGY